MSDNLNENRSVNGLTEFEVECVIRECLVPFPYIWASVCKISIDASCLMMLHKLLVCEYQLLLTLFQSLA